ncbi:response regulator transcription factor [Streptomyces sp. CA-278952]|uniref:response regulator n=1 Tax=unclassified Streptomyces TaxID=2593676 RepID=UPI002367BB36|nr:response regulator transcription factor [Streptomyces sp. CA-278952]WDG31216.1 response regulator transcription factor [Streptomyces sp. CA-278952]
MIRVVVVDDELLVRSGLRAILGSAGDIGVVADCGGAEAAATVARHRPDVLLLDIRMPDVDGLTVLGQIAALSPAPAIAMLTTFDAGEYVEAALTAGAAGFLMKNSSPEQLKHAVRVLAGGSRVLAPGAMAPVVDGYRASATTRDAARRVAGLTERERHVLALVRRGLSNRDIAGRLYLAHGTVKDHVSSVLAKLGGVNRVQAAVVADRAGLADPPVRER